MARFSLCTADPPLKKIGRGGGGGGAVHRLLTGFREQNLQNTERISYLIAR